MEKGSNEREVLHKVKTLDECDWNSSMSFAAGTAFIKKAPGTLFQTFITNQSVILVEEVKVQEMTNALSGGHLSVDRLAIIQKFPTVTVDFSSNSLCYAGSRYDLLPAIAASSLDIPFLAADHDEIVNGILCGAKVWYLMDSGDEEKYNSSGQQWAIGKARYVIERIENLKKKNYV